MKFTIIEDFENYNANPQGKNTDDCVIRALSLAYDLNYNSVKNELNNIARKDTGKFNYFDTIQLFIEKHGYQEFYNNENNKAIVDDVEDFQRKNRNGIYVVYCSNKTKQDSSNSFHLVTIINGKIYDTWDSANYYVLGAWKIKSSNYNRTINKLK